MPRWARFLSCSFTCLLLTLTGFLLAAYWWEGGQSFWSRVMEFLATTEFLYLSLLFGCFSALILIAARLLANLCGVPGPLAGLLAGAAVSLIYIAFILSAHAATWGGFAPALLRLWPSMAPFAAPFALAGAITTWLWERLD